MVNGSNAVNGSHGLNGLNGHGGSAASSAPFELDASLGVPNWADSAPDDSSASTAPSPGESTLSPTRHELDAELATLKLRHEAARTKLETLDESLRAVLAEEVAASRARFAEMDRHFESMIAAVHDDAMREVEHIRASAADRMAVEVGGGDE